MSDPSAGIGRQIAAGAAWMVAMRFAIRGIGLVSTLILARLLAPEDFGLVALATSLMAMIEVLGQFSFDLALIRDGKAGRPHYNTAWTLTIIRSVVLALVIALAAAPAARFFDDPRLAPIVYVLAAVTLAEGFQNIGVVDFRKDLKFRREFAFFMWQKLASFAVTIALAFLWRDYTALVAGIAAGRLAGIVLSFTMHPYRPWFSLAEWRDLFGFSKWLLLNNVIMFFVNKVDVFIVGRTFGAHTLGLYSVALEISTLPTTELIAPVQRALFPGFAKVSHRIDDLTRMYLDSLSVMLMLALPAGVGIALIAPLLVQVLLGSKWLEAIPIVQVLAIYGILRLSTANSGSVLITLGQMRTLTTILATYLVSVCILMVVGIQLWSVTGAAWGMVGAAAINLVLSWRTSTNLLPVGINDIFQRLWRTVLSVLVMCLSVLSFQGLIAATDGSQASLVSLLAIIGIGAGTYIAMLLGLWYSSGRPNGGEAHLLRAFTLAIGVAR